MTLDQSLILAVLAATIVAFLWGRWRHDLVALASLVACVVVGVVPAASAFEGFGHPAVITVAAVLVLSSGLRNTGVVDMLARRVLPSGAGRVRSLAILLGLGAALSAFMNNVGAMALLMPVAVTLARRLDMAPGQVLMPLAFGTILGGMTTLIGTPPNLIISGFRNEQTGSGFGMFDFSPVGIAVAVGGILLVLAGGWRLVPRRNVADVDSFETGRYLTEARVTERSDVVDRTVAEAESMLEEADAQIVGMARNDFRVAAPNMRRRLRRGDILVIEADPDDLASAISTLGLRLEAEVEAEAEEEAARSEDAEEEDPDAVAGSEGAEARGDEADPEETGDDDATEDEATEDEAGQVAALATGADPVARRPDDQATRERQLCSGSGHASSIAGGARLDENDSCLQEWPICCRFLGRTAESSFPTASLASG
jgi:hypothetical protein